MRYFETKFMDEADEFIAQLDSIERAVKLREKYFESKQKK